MVSGFKTTRSGDRGLFGPDSVTWRIHGDPCMIVGAVRALLIQALNPLAMAAVAQSSSFRTDPWGQLMRTADYVVITTFGDTETALAAGERVQAVHHHVRGVDHVTGLPYRASDPELLLWVHCAEVDSFLTSYRSFGGSLSDKEADRYVAEMVRAGELVGLPPEEVPDSVGALRDYLDTFDKLCVTPAAREGVAFLLNPPVSLPRRILWSAATAAAISILPRRMRDLYGFPWFEFMDPPMRLGFFSFYRLVNVISPRRNLVEEALSRWNATPRGGRKTAPPPSSPAYHDGNQSGA
jgi:uncharacterized protein (DUF2236 family)